MVVSVVYFRKPSSERIQSKFSKERERKGVQRNVTSFECSTARRAFVATRESQLSSLERSNGLVHGDKDKKRKKYR